VDCYATKHGRLVGVLEIKRRTHALGTHPTVYLNLRKWLALVLSATGLGVPALYVIGWADALGWVSVTDIDARCIRIGGWANPRTRADIEPVIEIPVSSFKRLDPPP
jgi:hypothetical protein